MTVGGGIISNNKNRINFNEPIADLIERLKREHRSFEFRLDEADNKINRDNVEEGIIIIHNMSESIIHHAVEEEARLMRVIMKNAKDDSSESIKVMQEHNYVLNFFRKTLPIRSFDLIDSMFLALLHYNFSLELQK